MKIITKQYKVKIIVTKPLFVPQESFALCKKDGNPLPYAGAPNFPPIGEDYEGTHRTAEMPELFDTKEDTYPDTCTTFLNVHKDGEKRLKVIVSDRLDVTYYNVQSVGEGEWEAEYRVVTKDGVKIDDV